MASSKRTGEGRIRGDWYVSLVSWARPVLPYPHGDWIVLIRDADRAILKLTGRLVEALNAIRLRREERGRELATSGAAEQAQLALAEARRLEEDRVKKETERREKKREKEKERKRQRAEAQRAEAAVLCVFPATSQIRHLLEYTEHTRLVGCRKRRHSSNSFFSAQPRLCAVRFALAASWELHSSGSAFDIAHLAACTNTEPCWLKQTAAESLSIPFNLAT